MPCVLQEESGLEDYETLDLYQQSLGELLLALAGKSLFLCVNTSQDQTYS